MIKILLVNYRYFISGGPERYFFNLKDSLEEFGNDVYPLSINYYKNYPTYYSKHFIDPIGSKSQIYFKQHTFDLQTIYRSFKRLFYDTNVEKKVLLYLIKYKPDIAYIQHYLRKFSPSLLIALKKCKIPIVVRLSDYAMLCPQGHCFRNGIPCKLCLDGNYLHSVLHKCIHNSFIVSLLNAVATTYHFKKKYFNLIDYFVVTNPFMYKLMISSGYSASRLKILPTFVDTSYFKPNGHLPSNVNTFIYSGRLEFIKGVHVVLRAFGKLRSDRPDLNWHLIIAGTGSNRYLTFLKTICSDYGISNRITFKGLLNKRELATSLSSAQIGIIPSLWYENLPNALLECFASGLPVIASDIGSFSYCIENYKNGLLFPPGNSDKLFDALVLCIDNPHLVLTMAHQSRLTAKSKFSKDKHITMLLTLFSDLIDRKKY